MLTNIYAGMHAIFLWGQPVTLICKSCISITRNKEIILQQKLVNILFNIIFILSAVQISISGTKFFSFISSAVQMQYLACW